MAAQPSAGHTHSSNLLHSPCLRQPGNLPRILNRAGPMFGIAELLRRFWNGREAVQRAMEQDFFPPPVCLICHGPWRYGSAEPGDEWVQCSNGHKLTKPDFDAGKPRPPMIGDGKSQGEI